MTTDSDPQLYASGYERNRLDRYWTNPWMTIELVKRIGSILTGPIWECAAGRGDMSRALKEHTGQHVYSSDVDMSEFDYEIGPGHERSFLDEFEIPVFEEHDTQDPTNPPQVAPCRSIITNPPYSEPWRGIADDFIEAGLRFMEAGEIDFMAMLLRSEFRSGRSKRRQDKFGKCSLYLGELVLTTRPRWDYGDSNAPEKASPRHNFSWFMWYRDKPFGKFGDNPIQIFSYMPKGFQP